MYIVTLTEEITMLRTIVLKTNINPVGKELLLRKTLDPIPYTIQYHKAEELYEPIIVEILKVEETNAE